MGVRAALFRLPKNRTNEQRIAEKTDKTSKNFVPYTVFGTKQNRNGQVDTIVMALFAAKVNCLLMSGSARRKK